VTTVETHPVDGARLDGAGWTSRVPIVTTHLVMESYRTTERGSILCTVRRMQMHKKSRLIHSFTVLIGKLFTINELRLHSDPMSQVSLM
jgi:hypothetical protein